MFFRWLGPPRCRDPDHELAEITAVSATDRGILEASVGVHVFFSSPSNTANDAVFVEGHGCQTHEGEKT